MRKLTLPIGLALTLSALSSQAAYDGKVDIADAPGLGNGSGGAFKVTVTAVTGTDFASVGKGVGSSFLSFCIEKDEYITLPGSGYDAELNSAAVQGGQGGPSPDPISKATAWLYKEFINGTLATSAPGFAWNNAGGNALQDAIWWLEEEGGSKNYLVTAAVTALGMTGWTDPNIRGNDANGAYGVKVINLFNGPPKEYGVDNQDMLVVVPEPTTYIAGGLLGLPFVLGALRMRSAKRAMSA